jgi:hypothetical protein
MSMHSVNQRLSSAGHREQYPITRGRQDGDRTASGWSLRWARATCSGHADFADSIHRIATFKSAAGLREVRLLYGFSILHQLLLFAGLAVKIVLCLVPWAAGP